MFSGIVQATAPVLESRQGAGSLTIRVTTPTDWKVKIGDSISTNGVCLTVAKCEAGWHEYCLVPETLMRTTFGERIPERVNLEQALRMGDQLNGHVVTGHVDCVGEITERSSEGDSWRMRISFPKEFSGLIVNKGSVAVDGISLTVAETAADSFVAVIIPHTSTYTTLGSCQPGAKVNLEFDILAKHLAKMAEKL